MNDGVIKSAGHVQQIPVRSRSTTFFERYAKAERDNIQLKGLVYILGGLVLGFSIIIGVMALTPRSVYYIPGAVASGTAYPDRVPVSSVESFAVSWLMSWMNYTPETIESVYKRAMMFMGPRLLSQVRGRLNEELEKVAQDRISSAFVIEKSTVVVDDKNGFRVLIDGRRGIYVGKEEMKWEETHFVLTIQRQAGTKEDPYGLAVMDMNKGGDNG